MLNKKSTFFLFLIVTYGNLATAQNFKTANTEKVSQAIADSLFNIPDFFDAKKMYEAILKTDPENTTNILRLSNCNIGLRLYDDALKSAEKYLLLNNTPNAASSANLYSLLAKIWSVKKDTAKGFQYLSRAVDSGYSRLDEFDYESDYNTLRTSPRFIALRQRAEINAFPCMTNPKAREFDFMIGEWDVYNNPATGMGTLVGYSKWDRISGGCAILENWTQVGPPHNGKSINYYDPEKKCWEQVWVGSEGVGSIVHRFLNGVYDEKEKVMKFEHDIERPNGKIIRSRFRFFNLDANTARQFKEFSRDGGKTWVVNYDFLYVRKK